MNCLIFLCTNHKPRTQRLAILCLYTSHRSLVMDFTYRSPKMLSRGHKGMSLSRCRPLHLPHRYHQHPPKQLQTANPHRPNIPGHPTLGRRRRDRMMLLLFQGVEDNPLGTSIHLQHRGLPQGGLPHPLLLLLLHTPHGLRDQYLQELPTQLPQNHLDRLPLQAASKAMDPLLQCQGRCMVAIMVIMENTRIAGHHIHLASTHLRLASTHLRLARIHLRLGILEHSNIIKYVKSYFNFLFS